MIHYLIAVMASLMALTALPAKASDITVICEVRQTADGQSPKNFKRRFAIDLEPRYFKTSVDNGKGFRSEEEGFPKDINPARIVFVDDGKILQYYDRTNSAYVYQDLTSGIEATGKCTEKRDTSRKADAPSSIR